MKLRIGFSPCPNDTFIFDAMIHHKIDTEGLEFELILADVEDLNQRAFQNELDITKLSYHTYAYLVKDYILLNGGSALGNNCGPLLISKHPIKSNEVSNQRIGIPGKFTTANFLLRIAFPEAKNKESMLFSDIEHQLLEEKIELGLIIHENRFTYQEKGLHKIIDLGEFWEEKTKLPIPLGGIVIKRNLPLSIQQKVDRVMQRSVKFALENPEKTYDFVKPHAQEMDLEVMLKHIKLYVNDYTLDLGKNGKKAITTLFEEAKKQGIKIEDYPLFIEQSLS